MFENNDEQSVDRPEEQGAKPPAKAASAFALGQTGIDQ
jgi:hypothetical protein